MLINLTFFSKKLKAYYFFIDIYAQKILNNASLCKAVFARFVVKTFRSRDSFLYIMRYRFFFLILKAEKSFFFYRSLTLLTYTLKLLCSFAIYETES